LKATRVRFKHFEQALSKVRPSVTKYMIDFYTRWLESARQISVTSTRPSQPSLTV